MIHIFPHMEYSIDSAKSLEDIKTILKSVTDSRKMAFGYSGNIEFTGEVNASDFKIVRRSYCRNDFRPVIMGTIRTKSGLTVIDIKMHMLLIARIFSAIWYSAVGFAFLVELLTAFKEGASEVAMLVILLLAVVLLAIGQVGTRIAFYLSAKKAIRSLEELLK